MGDVSPSWSDFVGAFELFRDPIVAAGLGGLVLGYLGVFIILRRMVFVTAAVSQAAGLGVALAFFAEIHLALAVPPVAGAAALALAATFVFAIPPARLRLSHETLLGAAYVSFSAAAIVVGDRIAQEAHDISSILFGTAVLVRSTDLWSLAGVGAVIALWHLWWYRGFVFAAFDPEGARTQRLPVRWLEIALWLSIALEVSVATRALGALPVFAFSVLPGATALLLGVPLGWTLLVAAGLGGVAGVAGYLVAFFVELPVGASQALVGVGLFVLVWLVRPRR